MARAADKRLVLLGRAVRALRSEAGLTQEQLADESGLHATYISGIERAQRNPSFLTLDRLAAGLGVSAAELIGRAEMLAARQPRRGG
jgi:transcriptional regulator with XRE-family HTH domain